METDEHLIPFELAIYLNTAGWFTWLWFAKPVIPMPADALSIYQLLIKKATIPGSFSRSQSGCTDYSVTY